MTVFTSWDADDYAESLSIRQTGKNPKIEASMMESYPPIASDPVGHVYTQPTTICDSQGIILAWHLPGAIMRHRQV